MTSRSCSLHFTCSWGNSFTSDSNQTSCKFLSHLWPLRLLNLLFVIVLLLTLILFLFYFWSLLVLLSFALFFTFCFDVIIFGFFEIVLIFLSLFSSFPPYSQNLIVALFSNSHFSYISLIFLCFRFNLHRFLLVVLFFSVSKTKRCRCRSLYLIIKSLLYNTIYFFEFLSQLDTLCEVKT